jgi:subtilisin
LTADGSQLAYFSNYSAKIAAVGVDVRSSWIGGGYNTASGTSAACPLVAATASRIAMQHFYWTGIPILKQLLGTGDMMDDEKGKTIRFGKLNVERALGTPWWK